ELYSDLSIDLIRRRKKREDRMLSTNSSNSNSANEDLRLQECFSDDNGKTSSRYRDNCLKLNKLSHLEVINYQQESRVFMELLHID
ncbi:115_t:CDS:2, partial [Entrophospora sp. SA101]